MAKRDEFTWEDFWRRHPECRPAEKPAPNPKRRSSGAGAGAAPVRGGRAETAVPTPPAEAPNPPPAASCPQVVNLTKPSASVVAVQPGDTPPVRGLVQAGPASGTGGIVAVNLGEEFGQLLRERAQREGKTPENLAAQLLRMGLKFLRAKP